MFCEILKLLSADFRCVENIKVGLKSHFQSFIEFAFSVLLETTKCLLRTCTLRPAFSIFMFLHVARLTFRRRWYSQQYASDETCVCSWLFCVILRKYFLIFMINTLGIFMKIVQKGASFTYKLSVWYRPTWKQMQGYTTVHATIPDWSFTERGNKLACNPHSHAIIQRLLSGIVVWTLIFLNII